MGLVSYFSTFYTKLLWLNFNGWVCCSEATLWPSEYICGRLEWVCAVWYVTRSPLTAASCWLSRYVQPYFTSPSFCVTETNRCADGVRFLHPFTMRTNARLVCLSMPRLKAGPHWVLKKAYRREWIGKQSGMWQVRNRKGSEFQWFWGFRSLFTAWAASFTKAVKTRGWQAQGLIYVWTHGTGTWDDAVLL